MEVGFNSNIPFIKIPFKGLSRPLSFMCDSGAEVNLIKLSVLKDFVLPLPIKTRIAGMCGGSGVTIGIIKLKIGDHFAIFHVMSDNYATFKSDGILGSEFFWEDGVDLLYSEGKLRVGKYSFKFLPRDKCKKISRYWLERAETEISNKNTWQNAEMEANIGGLLNDNQDEENLDNFYEEPENVGLPKTFDNDAQHVRNIDANSEKSDREILNIEIYEINYCDFRMSAYESEMDMMEMRKTNGEYGIYKPTELNYCQDLNFHQFKIFHNTTGVTSRLDKILKLAKLDDLNDKEFNSLSRILEKNLDLPYIKGDQWGGTNLLTHKITLSTNKPVNVRKHKIPYKLIDTVNDQIDEWLKLGIIRPSTSSFNSPIWVVPKKPDSLGNPRWRVVTDFRKLNEFTEDDSYPLPVITNIFDKIGGAKYYTKLDLSSGFLQIPVDPKDVPKTAFSTDFGHYEFLRMPFGMKTAPKTFQRAMDIALKGLIGFGVFVYMDDILIYAKNLEEHNRLLSEVFERLRKYNFKLEIDKCEFLKKEIPYLGHILSQNGVRPDEGKIKAVKNFPVPRTVKQIRQFLGLSGFYRRFVKNYAKIGRPLFDLLKKDIKFNWTKECQVAFEFLKNELCKAPILIFPNLRDEFLLFTDASGTAIGALLAQGSIKKNNAIAYYSRALKGPELNYSTYEKEALAIHDAIKHFRQYLFANKFTVITDHKPLLTMLEAENNGRVQKMRLKLQGYDLKIIHTPGKENLSADALSRNPVSSDAHVITRSMKKTTDKINVPEPSAPVVIVEKQNLPKKRGRPRKSTSEDPKNKGSPENEVNAPKKRGRPKKTIIVEDEEEEARDNPYSSGDESEVEIEQTADKHIIILKDLFEYRKDNLIYFVDENGDALEEGADRIMLNQRRPLRKKYEEGINSLRRKNKYLFEVVIDTNKSEKEIKEKVNELIEEVMKIMKEKKLRSISISKSDFISIIEWEDIYEMLRNKRNENVIIIICENILKYVPPEERNKIFNEMHESPQGGHRGILKTYLRIRRSYYWENLRNEVKERIKRCISCNLNKTRKRTKNPMAITDTPHRSFDKICCDIVGPYPKTTNGNEYVLTIQDQLTKFMVMIPLKNQTSESVSDAFIKRFISYFGCPKILLTDLGSNFTSKLFKQIAKKFRIKKVFTTVARPQSNASLEKSHGSLHAFLRQYIDKNNEWDDYIEFASLCYNTSVHESTGFTPYELVFGFEAREPSVKPTVKDITYGDYYEKLIKRLKSIQEKARENLIKTKERTKFYYDRNLNPNELKIGDEAYRARPDSRKKLQPYDEGPFEIVDVDPAHKNADVKLKKGKIRPVHLDSLRKALT